MNKRPNLRFKSPVVRKISVRPVPPQKSQAIVARRHVTDADDAQTVSMRRPQPAKYGQRATKALADRNGAAADSDDDDDDQATTLEIQRPRLPELSRTHERDRKRVHPRAPEIMNNNKMPSVIVDDRVHHHHAHYGHVRLPHFGAPETMDDVPTRPEPVYMHYAGSRPAWLLRREGVLPSAAPQLVDDDDDHRRRPTVLVRASDDGRTERQQTRRQRRDLILLVLLFSIFIGLVAHIVATGIHPTSF